MSFINAKYDEIIQSHPEEVKDAVLYLEQQMAKENCKFGDQIIPTFLKPFFISDKELSTTSYVIRHVMSILEKVTKLYSTHPDLRCYFYLDEKSRELVEIDPGYSKNVVICRPDSFLQNGIIRFVEFNCDSPAGPGYCDVQERIMEETYPVKSIARERELLKKSRSEMLLGALLGAYREFAGNNKNPNIAIVDWKEMRTRNEFMILKGHFESRGYETVVADPRDLKYAQGRLEYEGFPIDLVYRRAIFREIVERMDSVQDFLKAYRDGKVCMVNPLRSRLASNKAILAIITNQKQYKSFFTEEENHVIKKHIPWTRRLIDIETNLGDKLVFIIKHVIAHRDTLVLKPGDSYGGKDVIIGHETEQSQWEKLVSRIINNREDWVVQKYVDITEMTVPEIESGEVKVKPKKFNFNPFVFGGEYAGSMARLSDESVINVTAGGGMIPAVHYIATSEDSEE